MSGKTLKLNSVKTGKNYVFHTADGLNSKGSVRESELLLSEEMPQCQNLLVVQSNYGVLGVLGGEKAGHVVMHDTSARSCRFSIRNAGENNLEAEVVNSTLEEVQGQYDAIVYAPSGYEPVDLVKKRLGESAKKLSEGGQLLVAAEEKTGINRYRSYLKNMDGRVQKAGNSGKTEAWKFTRNGPPKPSRINVENQFNATVGEVFVKFKTAEGLFSAGELDDGTRLLLENIEVSGRKLLDLGCGYGAISSVLGRKNDLDLYLTDDDARAVKYARKNMEKNYIEEYESKVADCLNGFSQENFDTIVSNPPTHSGKDVTTKMFRQSFRSLKPGGELWLVYNQNMQYEKELSQLFNSVAVIDEEDNYRVVRCSK